MHAWGEETVIYSATCAKEGSLFYVCTACGETKTEIIPKTEEHRWDSGKIEVEPTKDTEGVYAYTCRRCGTKRTEATPTYNFDPADHGNPYHVCTSQNPENYIDFSINGNLLTVSGVMLEETLLKVWIRCGEQGEILEVTAGEFFSVELSLDGVTEKTEITVYRQKEGEDLFWSYIWRELFVVPMDGEYQFVKSMVLEHNIEIMSHWVKPSDYLSDSVSNQLVQLSNAIVGTETDEYKKIFLLHKWVAENIYYDYDYFYNRESELYYDADEVFEHKRSVCGGYANLLQALIQAQNIPCLQVGTFSAGVDTKGYFDETNYMTASSNHAHVEAYVNGRWVAMDPTWDSQNTYENGEYISGTPSFKYFDITLDFISFSHKIIRR